MLEIKNQKLYIDGKAIGDEERLLHLFDKAIKYDESQEEAGHALAKSLLGGA